MLLSHGHTSVSRPKPLHSLAAVIFQRKGGGDSQYFVVKKNWSFASPSSSLRSASKQAKQSRPCSMPPSFFGKIWLSFTYICSTANHLGYLSLTHSKTSNNQPTSTTPTTCSLSSLDHDTAIHKKCPLIRAPTHRKHGTPALNHESPIVSCTSKAGRTKFK